MKNIPIETIKSVKLIYKKLHKWNLARDTITNYFEKNKHKNSKEVILIKVSIIDSLYRTNLFDNVGVANHIYSIKSLDEDLSNEKNSAVEKIANWKKNILSFATKYCHFHNKEVYPLYDQYVVSALRNLIGWKDKRTYQNFLNGINQFKSKYNLESISLEDIDTFLWLYGQKLKLKKGKKDINKEVYGLYTHGKLNF